MLCVFVTAVAAARSSLAEPAHWRAEGWDRTDFSKTLVSWDEIISGGPGKDGIPPIDDPRFQPIANEQRTKPQEAVIAIEISGDARAYPIRLLMWHEIVNDTVGGVPVAITYCPLCNAAIVFDRRTTEGILTFGTTGKLRKSDLVMYDRQTESWWQQFSGKAIIGALTGLKLSFIASRLESFGSFRARYPKARVLIPNDPNLRAYGRNPYEGYDTSSIPFLYRGDMPTGIHPMVRVVSIRDAKPVTAVTLAHLRAVGRLSIGDVTLSWSKGQASALDYHTVSGGRDVGNVIAQKVGSDDQLQDVPYDVTFAFVFHAFHPDGKIISRSE